MGRREAREAAMTLLYSMEYHHDDIPYQIESFLENNPGNTQADSDWNEININLGEKDRQYIIEIADGVAEKMKDIDPVIEKYSKGWAFNRIPGIDVAVLRLCIYEMFYREDIPANVSINEAVDLAKKYGHDESGTFVNGILGSIYREAVKEGTLKEEADSMREGRSREHKGKK